MASASPGQRLADVASSAPALVALGEQVACAAPRRLSPRPRRTKAMTTAARRRDQARRCRPGRREGSWRPSQARRCGPGSSYPEIDCPSRTSQADVAPTPRRPAMMPTFLGADAVPRITLTRPMVKIGYHARSARPGQVAH